MKLQIVRSTLFALIDIVFLTTLNLAAAELVQSTDPQTQPVLGEQTIESAGLPDFFEVTFALGIIVGVAAVGIAIGIVAVIWRIRKRIPKRKTTLDILKNRLAKGEITKEEYDELKKEFES